MAALDLPPRLWLPPKPAILRPAPRERDTILRGTFPFPAFPAGPRPQIAFTQRAESTSDASVYNFTPAIGAVPVGCRRLVVIAFGGVNVSANRTATATIGGSAATERVRATGSPGGAFIDVYMFALEVNAGTTAAVAITWSGTQLRTGMGVWALYGLSSHTPTDTFNTTGTGALSDSGYSQVANGRGIAYMAGFAGSAPVYSWSISATLTPTEDFDATVESVFAHSGMHTDSLPTDVSGLTVTGTPSGSGGFGLVTAAFR